MAVPSCSLWGSLLLFDKTLDACALSVVALGYRFADPPHDAWTTKFNDFKFGSANVQARALSGASAVLTAALQPLSQSSSRIGVVCAHSHSATGLVPGSQVASLARSLAQNLSFQWCAHAITKQSHQSLQTLTSWAARDGEVHGKYTCAGLPAGLSHVMIVDDFTTRGATIAEIARAIRLVDPSVNMFGVVLGKNERQSYFQLQTGLPLSNSHIPANLAALWP